jgi:hypothetical protein
MRLGFLAAVMLACAPAAAHAAFGVASFSANTFEADGVTDFGQAGGRPPLGVTSATLNTLGPGGPPDGSVKYLRLDAPPGLITDPEAVPKCDEANASNCPVTSRIGDVTLRIFTNFLPPPGPGSVPPGQYTLPPLPLYNMVPPAGRPSEFAFSLAGVGGNPRVKILGGVRDTTDFGTFFELEDIPAVPPIVGTTLRFYGNPGATVLGATNTAFLSEPTLCGPPTVTKVTLESTAGEVATAETTSPGPTGCDQVPFAPSLSVTPSTTKRDSAAGGDIVVTVPQSRDPNVLATSHVEDTTITLPEGLSLNPSAANGLEACTDAQFGKGTEDPVACPAASVLGTAQIVSPPIAEPLTGLVYLGAPVSGDKYRLFLRAASDLAGVDVRLIGSIRPDAATGRVTTVFADTPQVPFSSLSISLDPAKQTLATPLACGPAATTSVLTPYRGAPDATPGSSTTIDADGAGAPCDGTPFAPGFTTANTSTVAGADTGFAADVTRADGQQFLSTLRVRQPEGLVGRIPAVPQCAEAQAAAGTCAAESRVGTATVAAGAGATPFSLTGPVYLTGPYKGAPFGLSIVVRALAGPFDLGTVVVRSAIRIDPRTAALTVEGDPLPQILEGIPLRLRRVNVNIDRQGFLLNGTGCTPRDAGAVIGSTTGTSATGSSTLTLTGCDRLAFTPKLAAFTSGRPTFARGASLFTTLTQPAGQMNLEEVTVQLPSAFLSRGTTLSKACLRDVFNADPSQCTQARVGTARLVTPTLPFTLTGDSFLVARDKERKLPTVETKLDTNLVRIDISSDITVDKRLNSKFPNLPDVPQTEFQLNLPQGKESALSFRGDPCSGKRSLPTVFTGQDGRRLAQTVPLTVEDCPVKILSTRVRADGRSAVLKVKVPEAGRLTVSGRDLQTVRRTFKRPATSATVTVRLTAQGVARLAAAPDGARALAAAVRTTALARLVPSAAAANGIPLTPSRSEARLAFPSRPAPVPRFTG